MFVQYGFDQFRFYSIVPPLESKERWPAAVIYRFPLFPPIINNNKRNIYIYIKNDHKNDYNKVGRMRLPEPRSCYEAQNAPPPFSPFRLLSGRIQPYRQGSNGHYCCIRSFSNLKTTISFQIKKSSGLKYFCRAEALSVIVRSIGKLKFKYNFIQIEF